MSLPKFLRSSVNPAELSMMVRGLFVALIPVAMVLTGMTENEFTPIIDATESFVFYATSAAASLWIIWGGIRKIAVALGIWK